MRLTRVLGQFPSVAALARQIGVSDNAIYKWIAGRGQPSVANLVSLSRTAGVSLEWLATGREPAAASHPAAPLRPRDHRSSTAQDSPEPGAGAPSDNRWHTPSQPAAPYSEYTFLPNRMAALGGGDARPFRSEQVVDSLAFKTEWLRRRLLASPHNLLLVEVNGDAMAPTLRDSDLILVDLGEPRFKHDGVYVLRRDGELIVKRLQRGPGGELIVKSDNPAYQPTLVSLDRVGIIGRVIWAAGRI